MSRAQRRREQRTARRQEEALATRQARREREARKRALNQHPDTRPLVIRILSFLWEVIKAAELRDFWRFAGVMALVGRGMGIDTRDERLPGWTGLNKPAKPTAESSDQKKEPRP